MKELIDIDLIQEQIIAFAKRDFSKRVPISEIADSKDSIIEGINMLGEELQATTISRDYFESIYNAVSDLLIVTNPDFNIVRVNKVTCEKLNKTEAELIGIDPRVFIKVQPSIIEGESPANSNFTKSSKFETTISINPETEIVLSCTITKLFHTDHTESGYLVICSDVTREKITQIEKLNLILSTQETERGRLAADLHDSLGQDLNAVMMYLQTLSVLDQSSQTYSSTYAECVQILERAIESIRDLSFDLMPKALQDKNLSVALQELVKKISQFKEINSNLITQDFRLSKGTEKVIYRICQEFVTNSLRHAKDSAMEINIFLDEDRIYFELKDKGPGFDLKKVKRTNGIKNINARLNAINAYSKWSTSNGTQLHFNLRYEEN